MYQLFGKEYSNLRVEILVTAFSRTIDWRGFLGSNGLYRLSQPHCTTLGLLWWGQEGISLDDHREFM